MKLAHSQYFPDESRQEMALRASLRAHAPEEIDENQAWAVFSQQFPVRKSSSRERLFSILPWFSGNQHRAVSWKSSVIVAAIAILALLIVGTATLLPVFPGSGNLAKAEQYQPVGISQSSNGTTFVADNAYASEAVTVIQYHVQPSADLIKLMIKGNVTMAIPGTVTLKDQSEKLNSGSYTTSCRVNLVHINGPISCSLYGRAFHPSAGTDHLDLSWDVSNLTISNITFPWNISNSTFPKNGPDLHGHWSKVVQGNWHFHFIIPFHNGKTYPA
jgi:hypothetical protein